MKETGCLASPTGVSLASRRPSWRFLIRRLVKETFSTGRRSLALQGRYHIGVTTVADVRIACGAVGIITR